MRLRAPDEAVELVRGIRGAKEAQVVVHGLDTAEPEYWQAMDRFRDRLLGDKSIFFVLSRSAAEKLTRHAPNLASVARPMVLFNIDDETTPTAADEGVQAELERLAAVWERETSHHSSFTKIVRHPAYQQIIAMGDRAIVPILRDLEQTRRPWGPALHAITGARPVAEEDAGKVSKITAAWLHWAREKGYVW